MTREVVADGRAFEASSFPMLVAGTGFSRTRPATAGTRWTAFNAIAEQLDYGRRYTSRTNQVQRSFEDTALGSAR